MTASAIEVRYYSKHKMISWASGDTWKKVQPMERKSCHNEAFI